MAHMGSPAQKAIKGCCFSFYGCAQHTHTHTHTHTHKHTDEETVLCATFVTTGPHQTHGVWVEQPNNNNNNNNNQLTKFMTWLPFLK